MGDVRVLSVVVTVDFDFSNVKYKKMLIKYYMSVLPKYHQIIILYVLPTK